MGREVVHRRARRAGGGVGDDLPVLGRARVGMQGGAGRLHLRPGQHRQPAPAFPGQRPRSRQFGPGQPVAPERHVRRAMGQQFAGLAELFRLQPLGRPAFGAVELPLQRQQVAGDGVSDRGPGDAGDAGADRYRVRGSWGIRRGGLWRTRCRHRAGKQGFVGAPLRRLRVQAFRRRARRRRCAGVVGGIVPQPGYRIEPGL